MTEVEELNALQASNRRQLDTQTERKLVRLRNSMFAQREKRVIESFPIVNGAPDGTRVGLPVLTRAELNIDRLRDAMVAYGVVHIKGLLDQTQVETMRKVVDSAMDAQERAHNGAPVEETVPWFEPTEWLVGGPMARAFVRNDSAVLAADSPRGLFHLLEVYYQAGIDKLVGEYFGERPALSSEKTTLRRATPAPLCGEWHQDGRFLGSDIRSLNLWVALSSCPADGPGGPPVTPALELVAQRLHRIVQTGTEDATFDWTVADNLVQREFVGKVVRPQFAAGDALFFDHFSLHRTWRCAGMLNPRYALESWFFAPSKYPDTQSGIYV
jgi:hypothetical protein